MTIINIPVDVMLYALLVSLVLALGATWLVQRFHLEHRVKQYLENSSEAPPTLLQTVVRFSERFTRFERDDIRYKCEAAGLYSEYWARFFAPVKMFLMICLPVLLYLFLPVESTQNRTLIALAVFVAAIIGPDAWLRARQEALAQKISGQLPYLLDLMGVCVQTGMTIEAAMFYLTREMAEFDRDMAHLLKKTSDRAKVVGLEPALEDMLKRVPTNEMRSFVNTLSQSLHYGTSIYGVLTTLAKDIREIQLLQLEEKVGKLSSKMSVPLILFIMFPVVVLIVAPGIMRMFPDG
ncbi:type II secretion system F family protein [Grimontia sp. SpTr1]|uniref:type II secretion system F family protein n=1 Tax=Grimontia sp. SpTr1 TaxID=2995319 RepID=UPI00248CEAF9|nr:type II secretion system F family protein [Grimontia sp. SpTr1]